jgi:cation diffusion facilitator CzcD-associated flavoprotein CzcO
LKQAAWAVGIYVGSAMKTVKTDVAVIGAGTAGLAAYRAARDLG